MKLYRYSMLVMLLCTSLSKAVMAKIVSVDSSSDNGEHTGNPVNEHRVIVPYSAISAKILQRIRSTEKPSLEKLPQECDIEKLQRYSLTYTACKFPQDSLKDTALNRVHSQN